MHDEGEVSLVQSGYDPLVFLLLHRRVRHVAYEAKLEDAVLRLCGYIADASK
jgi:hypothetical protein